MCRIPSAGDCSSPSARGSTRLFLHRGPRVVARRTPWLGMMPSRGLCSCLLKICLSCVIRRRTLTSSWMWVRWRYIMRILRIWRVLGKQSSWIWGRILIRVSVLRGLIYKKSKILARSWTYWLKETNDVQPNLLMQTSPVLVHTLYSRFLQKLSTRKREQVKM